MVYTVRVLTRDKRLIGYEVFNAKTWKSVKEFLYAKQDYDSDQHGINTSLSRALEHASQLNGVLNGKTSEAQDDTTQCDAATSPSSVETVEPEGTG